jgi:hypothetical protein
MAIAYRTGVAGTNATRTSFTLTIPATAQVGDRAIIWLEIDTDRTVTPPTGWALVKESNTAPEALAWEHEVAAGEPGTATGSFTWVTTEFSCPAMDLWSGVASGTSALSGTPSSNSGSSSTATATAMTTLDANTMVIFVAVNDFDLTATSAAGTERQDTTHGASYDVAQPAAGTTGSKTVTLSGSHGWATVMFALKPSAVAAANPPARSRSVRSRIVPRSRARFAR